eukprot:1060988-Prorocentrum_minimum.AAC.1
MAKSTVAVSLSLVVLGAPDAQLHDNRVQLGKQGPQHRLRHAHSQVLQEDVRLVQQAKPTKPRGC